MTLGSIKIPLIVAFRPLFSVKNYVTAFTVKIEIFSELMLNSFEDFFNYTVIERCCNFLIRNSMLILILFEKPQCN